MTGIDLLSVIFVVTLVIIFLLLPLLLKLIALIDIFRSRFTGNNQLFMALIVLLVPFGAIIYFFSMSSLKVE